MLILQLKQCERALADGRLDEAFDLVRRPEVRAHRRGQDLVTKMVGALVTRGRGHLAQGRLTAAATDASKACMLGGNIPDAVQLQQAVGTARRDQEKTNEKAGHLLALARRHAEMGQLSLGERLLDEVPMTDSRLDDLKLDLAQRRAGLEAAYKKAKGAFESGDWEAAVDHIARVGKQAAHDANLRGLIDQIGDHVAGQATSQLESGRLDSAAMLLDKIAGLPVDISSTRRLRTSLAQCRAASNAIVEGSHHEAELCLGQLKLTWPKAKWIAELSEQVREWGKLQTVIRTSPLSLLPQTLRHAPTKMPNASPAPLVPTPPTQNLVLHVDGVGSFQIITGSTISIGPRSSTRSMDLALMIDPAAPRITLSRSDGDYFLKSDQPATVNEVPVTSRLLNNGDRIGLGPRCRMTFRRPSPASGTALLDLAGGQLPAGVRQVILMDREIIIGPGNGVHIRADQLASPTILTRDGDSLSCKGTTPIFVDDQSMGTTATLPTGIPISVGTLRFVVSGSNAHDSR